MSKLEQECFNDEWLSGRAVASESSEEEFSELVRKHRWRQDERLALCILRRFYEHDWKQVTRVFTRAFRVVPKGRLHFLQSQMSDMRRLRVLEYREVFENHPFSEPLSGHLAKLERRLKTAARNTGVLLRRRYKESAIVRQPSGRVYQSSSGAAIPNEPTSQHAASTNKDRVIIIISDDESSDDEGSLSECSSRALSVISARTVELDQSRQALKPPSIKERSFINELSSPEAVLPSLLFRFHDDSSQGFNATEGFRAGLFDAITAHKTMAPSCNDPVLLRHVTNHLNRVKTPSPLISLTHSLIWVLHKALQSKSTARITVIDTRRATDCTKIWHAAPLWHKIKAAGQASFRFYGGNFEYLAWARILGEAIIGTFTVDDLKTLCASSLEVSQLIRLHELQRGGGVSSVMRNFMPISMDHDVGIAIGTLLKFIRPSTMINEPVVEDFLQVMLQNWQVSGDHKCKKSRKSLMLGVSEGLVTGAPHLDVSGVNVQPNTSSMRLQETTSPTTVGGLMTPNPTPRMTCSTISSFGVAARSLLQEFKDQFTPLLVESGELLDPVSEDDTDTNSSVFSFESDHASSDVEMAVEEKELEKEDTVNEEVEEEMEEQKTIEMETGTDEENSCEEKEAPSSTCRCHIGLHVDE